MPLESGFRERAEHNERFLSSFDLYRTEYLDWAVTTAFYVAVRYVDAFFFPKRPHNHEERLEWVRTDPHTRVIGNEYRELFHYSRNSRYELTEFTAFEVDSLIANRLSRVKAHMLRQ